MVSWVCMNVGLISDTHGHLSEAAVRALSGVDLIVHAGDVGLPDILDDLQDLATVIAVRGNCDVPPLSEQLPSTTFVPTPAGILLVSHQPPGGDHTFASLKLPEMPRIIVFGHTHYPRIIEDGPRLLVNPGSAHRGRGAPPTVAVLHATDGTAPSFDFIDLSSGMPFPVSISRRHARD